MAPLVVFLAYANDRDDRARYLRNLPEETRRLRSELAISVQAGHCEVIERSNATARDILDIFQADDYRDRIAIFHYAGHADSYHLLFESNEGKPAPMDGASFARFLGLAAGKSLQLVFLNGCSTARQATALLDAGVKAVLVTDRAIDDAAATEFASRFYHGLANGASIGAAFAMAQAALPAEGIRLLRAARPVGSTPETEVDRLPWELHIRSGAESVQEWSLPQAAKDPLFGLPPLPKLDLPQTPFRHLHWFDRDAAEIFFGRGRDIRHLYEMVTAPDAPPILLLYGQSGVGKSSLLAAGLLPRLEEQYTVRYLRRDSAGGLTATLLQALGVDSVGAIETAWRRIEEDTTRPLLLILDQVEEAYTRQGIGGEGEVAELLAGVVPLFAARDRRPQGRLLLGFRKEWLPDVERQLQEKGLAYGEHFLERLDRDGVIEAITGPATVERLRNHYHLQVEEGLAGRMADDLLEDAGAAVAPTLQILLTQLWKKAKQQHNAPTFTGGLYVDLKRRGVLLGDFLDQQLAGMRERLGTTVDSGLALDLLRYHTTPLGTAAEHSQEELAGAYQHQKTVLPALVKEMQERYLLADTAQPQPDTGPGTRLAHDALAPLVQERFARSTSPGQQARRLLENRAVEWSDGKIGTPLDERDLARVEAGLNGMTSLYPDEERLLAASRLSRDSATRWRRLVVSTIGVLAALLLLVWQRDTITSIYLRYQSIDKTEVVDIAGMSVDKYEVTVELHKLCEDAKVCSRTFVDVSEPDIPITSVDAFDAYTYCRWVGRKLPTHQEWEAIFEEAYPPQENILQRYDVEKMNLGTDGALPVRLLRDNSPDGVVGLIGNVMEWTRTIDPSESDSNKEDSGSEWDGVAERPLLLQGGSYFYSLRYRDLSELQYPALSSVQNPDVGFRCVAGE